jgi:hypothetical protein
MNSGLTEDQRKSLLSASCTAIVATNEIEGSFLDGSEQFIGDTRVFGPHDALFRAAKAQEVDAPVPDNFLIDHGEFLVDVRFVPHLDAGCIE